MDERECEEEANRKDDSPESFAARSTIKGAIADIAKAQLSNHGAIFSLFFCFRKRKEVDRDRMMLDRSWTQERLRRDKERRGEETRGTTKGEGKGQEGQREERRNKNKRETDKLPQ